jgi:hypothetical protein
MVEERAPAEVADATAAAAATDNATSGAGRLLVLADAGCAARVAGAGAR